MARRQIDDKTMKAVFDAGAAVLKNRIDSGVIPLSQVVHHQSSIRYIRGAEAARDGIDNRSHVGKTPMGISYENMDSFYLATVRSVDYGAVKTDRSTAWATGSVEVEIDKNGQTIHAKVMRGFSSRPKKTDVGYEPESTVTGQTVLPQVGDRVIVVFILGMKTNAVVIGGYPASIYDSLYRDKHGNAEPNKKLNVHPSFQWTKTNNDGDLEMKFPDDTFISIKNDPGTAVFPATPPDASKDLSERRNPKTPKPEKTITISHSSGTWVRIKADGDVEIKASGDVSVDADKITFKVGGVDNIVLSSGKCEILCADLVVTDVLPDHKHTYTDTSGIRTLTSGVTTNTADVPTTLTYT